MHMEHQCYQQTSGRFDIWLLTLAVLNLSIYDSRVFRGVNRRSCVTGYLTSTKLS